jgi:LPS-assembly protein
VFERDTQVWGRAMQQTLEPRAYYVHTPYRDQSSLPNYDSGQLDFNFATLYSPNAFAGNDRISDSHQMTLGLTSRLINAQTGAEALRFGVAQRLRFSDQNVTLPTQTLVLAGQTLTQPGTQTVTGTSSDFLVGSTVNWTSQWMLDSLVQFDPTTHAAKRTGVSMRYNPGNYRVFSAGYRYQRDQSEQVDLGWQWPLNGLWGDAGMDMGPGRGLGEGQWYSVGRMNFSLRDRKMVNSLYGFEYDAGCWLGRVVLERLQRPDTTTNTRLLFQLEFVGFSRVGTNPLQSLKQNIPRYQLLRDQVTPPSRFGYYD